MLDEKSSSVEIRAEAKVTARTGVEMEALTAVTVAALTIYDMCKAVDRGMEITDIRLIGEVRRAFRAFYPARKKLLIQKHFSVSILFL